MNKKKNFIICLSVISILTIVIILNITDNKKYDNVSETNNQNNITIQEPGITINKSEITNIAKFYKYKSKNTEMEIMAVKADDDSIRTAFNTCQVCYDSGRGYYKQQGDYMVCQNCGNRFNLNQIEQIKGGCNPVPILKENKTETSDTITISKEYLDSQKEYFENWK